MPYRATNAWLRVRQTPAGGADGRSSPGGEPLFPPCQGVGHRQVLWWPEQHAQEAAGAALRRRRMIEAVPAVAALPGCRENQFSAVRACLRRPLVDGCASLRFLLPGWSFFW